MSKQIRIAVKDIEKLEFELLEDANKGDFINLNQINQIDLTEIKEILNKKKDEYIKPIIEQEKEEIKKNAVNDFIASKNYQDLLTKIKDLAVKNAELTKDLNNSANEFRNSQEYQNLIKQKNESQEEITRLNEELKSNFASVVQKFKESNEYKNLQKEIEDAKIKESLLNQEVENAVTKFKSSKEYTDLRNELNYFDKKNVELQIQLDNAKMLAINEFKNSDIYKDLLNAAKKVDELKVKYETKVENAVLAYKNSDEYKSLINEKNQVPVLNQKLNTQEEKIKLLDEKYKTDLQNAILNEKPNIIAEFKKSEEYTNLLKDNEYLSSVYGQRWKNNKSIGENFENIIYNEYINTYSTAFSDATLKKANDVIEGTKPDFLFEVFNSNLAKNDANYITGRVVIEAKTEFSESEHHKKNSNHYKKLDADRRKNKGDYAILVTTLESDKHFGIYLVQEYENMFVVRLEWLMPLLSLIRRIFLKKQKIEQLNMQFKSKLELKEMFDNFRADLLDKTFKNMRTKLENIQKMATGIIKNANAILDDQEKIVTKYMNAVRNKIDSFKIEKIANKVEKIEDAISSNEEFEPENKENLVLNKQNEE